MITDITRNERHDYFIGDEPTAYPSVTTIIKATTSESGLIGWVRRHAIEHAIELLPELRERISSTNAGYADMLETRITRAALHDAEFGDLVHRLIERHIKGALGRREFAVQPADVQSSLRQFFAFEAAYQPAWEWSERQFVDVCHGYGGTADAAAYIDGIATLIDFKTGSKTWLEHILQLAAYVHAMHQDGLRYTHAAILHLAPGEPFRFHEIELTEWDFKAFVDSLDKYRWMGERKEIA